MTYSVIGILAAAVLLISNRDLFWRLDGGELAPTQSSYRSFLLGVMCYYVTDALWGLLDAHRLTTLLYADTAVHFAAMAAAVMLWTQYVISYLEGADRFERLLYHTGRVFFLFETVVVVANFFRPVLFWFDADGSYHAGPARYATLAIQILMFLLTSVYTLRVTARSEGRVRLRNRTIGFFGIAMTLLIAAQVFFPLLPLYAVGYMLGTSILHSFVLEDEKEENRRELERAVERGRLQSRELAESREALRDALAAAERANRAKTAFLSNMSQEIRAPMNAIISLNNTAMNDPAASDEVKECLEKIGGSAQRLLGIINDILDMSSIESGRMTVQKEEFSFADALEQVNAMIGGQCSDKGLRYDCRVLGRVDDRYIGDAMKLRQALVNILGNAVKFTPEGGEVLFTVEETARFDKKAILRFTIRDTGIGMSREYLPHIFEAFSQEDSSSASRLGSTGLGLSIAKNIVELMNGQIDMESEKGKGTTFTVTVTLGQCEQRDEAAREGRAPRES